MFRKSEPMMKGLNRHHPPQRSLLWSRLICLLAIFSTSIGNVSARLYAQAAPLKPVIPQATATNPPQQTTVRMDLLTGPEGVGIKGQAWLELSEELEFTLQIRRGIADDKPDITERTIGPRLREVRVIGKLESDGSITVPGKRFKASDGDLLREWISGLKAYGAQGSPKDQPVWGLTRAQFDPLFTALSKPAREELQGDTLDAALKKFHVQEKYPFQFTAAAQKHLSSGKLPVSVTQNLNGLTEGTALSVLLNEFGLGYAPQRLPNGKIELAFVPLKEGTNVWPAGWQPSRPGPDIAPQLFEVAEIELQDEPLAEVLAAVGDLVKLPVLYDHTGLASRNINLAKYPVSHPKKKVPWSLALKRFTFQARCRWELRVDEAGHPFIWTFPEEPPAPREPAKNK